MKAHNCAPCRYVACKGECDCSCNETVSINTPEGLRYARLAAVKGRLKLEGMGLRFKGPTILKRMKSEFGTKTREATIAAIQHEMDEILKRHRGE